MHQLSVTSSRVLDVNAWSMLQSSLDFVNERDMKKYKLSYDFRFWTLKISWSRRHHLKCTIACARFDKHVIKGRLCIKHHTILSQCYVQSYIELKMLLASILGLVFFENFLKYAGQISGKMLFCHKQLYYDKSYFANHIKWFPKQKLIVSVPHIHHYRNFHSLIFYKCLSCFCNT